MSPEGGRTWMWEQVGRPCCQNPLPWDPSLKTLRVGAQAGKCPLGRRVGPAPRPWRGRCAVTGALVHPKSSPPRAVALGITSPRRGPEPGLGVQPRMLPFCASQPFCLACVGGVWEGLSDGRGPGLGLGSPRLAVTCLPAPGSLWFFTDILQWAVCHAVQSPPGPVQPRGPGAGARGPPLAYSLVT